VYLILTFLVLSVNTTQSSFISEHYTATYGTVIKRISRSDLNSISNGCL